MVLFATRTSFAASTCPHPAQLLSVPLRSPNRSESVDAAMIRQKRDVVRDGGRELQGFATTVAGRAAVGAQGAECQRHTRLRRNILRAVDSTLGVLRFRELWRLEGLCKESFRSMHVTRISAKEKFWEFLGLTSMLDMQSSAHIFPPDSE